MQVLPSLVRNSIIITIFLRYIGFDLAADIRVWGQCQQEPDELRECRYTHVLSSPELLTGKRFKKKIKNKNKNRK